jgi:hypothetical protein
VPSSPPATTRTRLRRPLLVALGACGLVVLAAAAVLAVPPDDPVEDRVMGELTAWTDWLDEHDVEGFLGEVSWPSDDPTGRWTSLAHRWLDHAADADVPVTYWAAGEVFDPDTIPYLAYARSTPDGPVDTVRDPGELLEERQDEQVLGLNVAGGAYNTCATREVCETFDAEARGRDGQEWWFDTTDSLDLYAERGHELLRVEVRWERLQPDLDEPLDEDVVAELERLLDDAAANDQRVVLSLHNYGAYYEAGTGQRRTLGVDLDEGQLTSIWSALSERLGEHEAVHAYGLMNEPLGMGVEAWERMSAATVADLRDAGDETLVLVGGYDLSNVHSWPHDEPWVDDDHVRYEAHHHLDRWHGAAYENDYREEVAFELDRSDADLLDRARWWVRRR